MQYIFLESLKDAKEFLNDLTNAEEVYVDTETTSLNPFQATLILIQVGIGEKNYIFDARKLGSFGTKYLVQQIGLKKCVFQNAKFDLKIIKMQTGEMLQNVYCTMLAENLITSGIGRRFHSLVSLAKKYCDVEIEKEVRTEFMDNPDVIITEQILIYASLDISYLKQIKEKQLELIKSQKQERVLDLEMKLIPVTADMELNGILLNKEKWNALGGGAEEKAIELGNKLLDEIIEQAVNKNYKNALEACNDLGIEIKTKWETQLLEGITELSFIRTKLREKVDLNSSKQMKYILNNLYNAHLTSTNAKVLDKIKNEISIIETILAFREATKAVSSFGESFIEKISPETGRIHSQFNQLGTSSGRYSSENPNLQNVKRENEYRNCFIAREGYKIVGGDFSQQELRVLANIADDKNMQKAFAEDLDLHAYTASLIFNKEISDVTKEERFVGKTMNFAVVYGSSEFGLFRNFNIALDDGKVYLDKFYNTAYTGVRDFKKIAGETIWEKGYATTLLGRKRFFEKPTIFPNSREFYKFKMKTLRELINQIIQGSSADITKLALCKVYYENPFGKELKILLTVHDEIVVEVKEEYAEQARKFLEKCMLDSEKPFIGSITAKAETYVADFWQK